MCRGEELGRGRRLTEGTQGKVRPAIRSFFSRGRTTPPGPVARPEHPPARPGTPKHNPLVSRLHEAARAYKPRRAVEPGGLGRAGRGGGTGGGLRSARRPTSCVARVVGTGATGDVPRTEGGRPAEAGLNRVQVPGELQPGRFHGERNARCLSAGALPRIVLGVFRRTTAGLIPAGVKRGTGPLAPGSSRSTAFLPWGPEGPSRSFAPAFERFNTVWWMAGREGRGCRGLSVPGPAVLSSMKPYARASRGRGGGEPLGMGLRQGREGMFSVIPPLGRMASSCPDPEPSVLGGSGAAGGGFDTGVRRHVSSFLFFSFFFLSRGVYRETASPRGCYVCLIRSSGLLGLGSRAGSLVRFCSGSSQQSRCGAPPGCLAFGCAASFY